MSTFKPGQRVRSVHGGGECTVDSLVVWVRESDGRLVECLPADLVPLDPAPAQASEAVDGWNASETVDGDPKASRFPWEFVAYRDVPQVDVTVLANGVNAAAVPAGVLVDLLTRAGRLPAPPTPGQLLVELTREEAEALTRAHPHVLASAHWVGAVAKLRAALKGGGR